MKRGIEVVTNGWRDPTGEADDGNRKASSSAQEDQKYWQCMCPVSRKRKNCVGEERV
eukprot:CAMPEP_0198458264 /NCGR_PEP_ID=MMETSP1453-20131121/34505_1 /TAXON_ID=1461543 ORGANISM="Unidentified sp., Strain RCC701" /NCGR_SAMPLE_ID=MMETSP1453 /ASSEMBLY_ACC=CAM_ASM_001118 /LENGTH=56 /DNA_ID=CAMNT_0044183099 /DNA_START=12 /DNA_END=178 /DNA_ORIENTATION=-